MSIEKNTKNTLSHEDGGWTTTLNSTVQNIKNDSALGIYVYLASQHAGWEICKKHLMNHFGRGRDYIDKCFKYLKEIGAIEITVTRNSSGKITGWDTKLKTRISVQYVQGIQNTENPYSGKKTRSLKNQNLVKPESGETAPINKETEKKEVLLKKQNNKEPVIVFSDSSSVRVHLDLILRNRQITLTEDCINQILYSVGNEKDFDKVIKIINIALKLIREKKWQAPYGYNATPASLNPIASKKETDQERMQRFAEERQRNKDEWRYKEAHIK
jgi:hypothetical protein